MNWQEKERRDWLRAKHNLEPAPLDRQDKIVIAGCFIVSVMSAVILAFWGPL